MNEIKDWTEDFEKAPIFWLNGLAGTGNSAIAQTFTETLFTHGCLGASFPAQGVSRIMAILNLSSPHWRSSLHNNTQNFGPPLLPSSNTVRGVPELTSDYVLEE